MVYLCSASQTSSSADVRAGEGEIVGFTQQAFIVAFKKKKKERKKTKKTEDLMLQRNGKQAVEVELWKSRVFACES